MQNFHVIVKHSLRVLFAAMKMKLPAEENACFFFSRF